MAEKGAVKNSNKMGALISSMLETSQNLATCKCILAPLILLILPDNTSKLKGVRFILFPSTGIRLNQP
jgi:hypothetical protein